MEILGIKVLRGPNYWSNYRKNLIVVNLDIRDFEYKPTNLIVGFYDRLKILLPSLYSHQCSQNKEGGFFERVAEGTWLGHVFEHIALELQYLAGMPCVYGRTRSSNKVGIYHVVFEYTIANAGLYSAEAAFNILQAIVHQENYLNLESDIKNLKNIMIEEGLGPSTQAIVDAAIKRNIPVTRLDHESSVMFGFGKNQKMICATLTLNTSSIAVENASNKEMTKQILSKAFIPVPKGTLITYESELNDAIEKCHYPCVIKPLNGNHGRGITTNITNKTQAIHAFKLAKKISDDVIVENYVVGFDYRFLLINFKLQAVAKRTPALIIGNGINTIKELIDLINGDDARGNHHENTLTKIDIDEMTFSILAKNNLTIDSILPKDKKLILKYAANLSRGGTASDVTDIIHADYILLTERVARIMNLDICGVDLIAADITKPIEHNNMAVLEVNSGPGLRMHLAPSSGKPRAVAKAVVDMLYPDDMPSRIPIIAVTGTNGKTTTVRLIAHIIQNVGFQVGYTTTEGIYIQNKQIYEGDCSGPVSAEAILRDPLIEFAVFECARGGILRAGLGFDHCDISIVLNVTNDHLGQDDIETLEDLARVKEVVAISTLNHGYAILNADDDLVYHMSNHLECNIALFSIKENNERIINHCAKGGIAIYKNQHEIIIQNGNSKDTIIQNINDIPLYFNGQAFFMLGNLMPALLACYLSGFNKELMVASMKRFLPNQEFLPGRINIINFPDFKLMIDYAHNEVAILNMQKFLETEKCNKIIGIISATGDRRDKDIIKMGYQCSLMFDEIIIKHDLDGRGRTQQELTALLLEGIKQNPKLKEVRIISDEFKALDYAIQHAQKNNFIYYFPDNVLASIKYINERYFNLDLMQARSVKE